MSEDKVARPDSYDTLDDSQAKVVEWGAECFGPVHMARREASCDATA